MVELVIEKYKDRVRWEWIFLYQSLSKNFIKKHLSDNLIKSLKKNVKLLRTYNFCLNLPLDLSIKDEAINITKFFDVHVIFKW